MRCVERIARRTARAYLVGAAVAVTAGCSGPPPPERVAERTPLASGSDERMAAGETPPRLAMAPGVSRPALPAPRPVGSWAELRQQAGERLVAANPAATYMGEPPAALLAIPVLEVELNGDGSVRRIVVLRQPRQALDTTQLAIDAVHRAAPYGDVRRLPRPWKFAETFLFDEQRRFKPRSLD